MKNRKYPIPTLLACGAMTVAVLAKTGCAPPASSTENRRILREALTQAPNPETFSGAGALTPTSATATLLGRAYRRPAFASAGKNFQPEVLPPIPIDPPSRAAAAPGAGDGSSPQALNRLADQLKKSIHDAKWIEAPTADNDDTTTTTTTPSTDDGDTEVASLGAIAAPAVCSSVEYAGAGTSATESDRTLNNRASVAFHDAQEHLLGWLAQNRHRFPVATYAYFEAQIQSAKLKTAAGDPDLEWRGIGVWTRDAITGDAVITLGNGFFTLMHKQPARAKFELTRLLAQTWSPCELEKKKVEQPWSAYLRCMGFTGVGVDQDLALGCGAGGYSEAGWAVSSAVAETIANPGCQIPAFNEPTHAECPKSFLLPLMIGADHERHPASETQEARK